MGANVGRMNAKDWVLAMLYIAGGKVRGKTRIHKGIFLVHADIESVDTPSFRPYDYGPWSPEIEEAIKELIKEGLIRMYEEPGGDEALVQVYELTERGRKVAEEIMKKLENHPESERIKKRLLFASKVPLTILLAYVYGMYPEYTVKSRIKRKVRAWSLYPF